MEYAQQSSSARGIGRPMGPWVVRLGEGLAATDLMFLCYGELPAYFDWLFQVKGGGYPVALSSPFKPDYGRREDAA